MFKRLFFLISIILVLGLVGNASADLVGRWTFDDGTADDSSGNDHHGTLKQGDEGTTSVNIIYDADMDSNVLVLVNPADHIINSVVDCGAGEWTDMTNAITLMCWTKLENINISNQYLMSHGAAYQYTTNGTQDGIRVYMEGIGDNTLVSPTPITGSWHHIAFTYDADASSRVLYIDGIKVNSDTPSGGVMISADDGFIIGGRLNDNFDHRGWDGRINDVQLYDHALSEGEIRGMNGVYSAFDPNPGNEAEYVSETLPSLIWEPGAKVAATGGHKVYLGTSQALVDANDALVYKGAFDTNSYSGAPMGSLALGTTYYWRVTEVNGIDEWPGDVWQFSTPPLEATEADPPDGAKYVSLSRTKVGWKEGTTATNHAVYFGTSKALIDANDTSVYKGTVNVPDPCEWTISPALIAGETYYWRIDVNAPEVYPGDVWSFTTMAAPTGDPNLVAWWKLDETSKDGKNVFDASGNEHYGTLENFASIVADSSTGEDVLELNGIDDFVSCGLGSWADITGHITMTAQIKVNVFNKTWQTIFGKGTGTYRLMRRASTDTTSFYLNVYGTPYDRQAPGATNVNDDEWHHVAGVFDGDMLYLYVDGRVDGTGVFTDGFIVVDTHEVFIGKDSQGNHRQWNGWLSDIRLYNRALSALEIAIMGLKDPNQAWWSYPAHNAVDVSDSPLTLTWRSGVKAAATGGHRVYFGTDKALVDANDASVDYLAQDVNYLDVGKLAFDTTYYWRVDESNGATTWRGLDWTFDMANYKHFEDFESYVGNNLIGLTWELTAWTGGAINLGMLSNYEPVNGGERSMKYEYDNQSMGGYFWSEAYRDFDSSPQDWSYATGDVKSLQLNFYGETGNDSDDMWVVLKDSSTNEAMKLYDGDLDDLKAGEWKEWDIDLSDFTTVNLASVQTVYIGFGERGNYDWPFIQLAGTVYFDDLRVYPPRCVPSKAPKAALLSGDDCLIDEKDVAVMAADWLDRDITVTPSNPGDSNLVGCWNFDDLTANDSSGRGHHGTIVEGDPCNTSISIVYDAIRDSNVLDVNNVADANNSVVDCGGGPGDADPNWSLLRERISLAAWFTLDDIHTSNQYLITKGHSYQITSRTTEDGIRVYMEELSDETVSTAAPTMDGDWHHLATTYDSIAKERKLYIDGQEVNSDTPSDLLDIHTEALVIGGRLDPEFIQRGWQGRIDDVRLYDDVLTHEEVVHLAGYTSPTYFNVYSPANLTDAGDPCNYRFVDYKDFDILADGWLTDTYWP